MQGTSYTNINTNDGGDTMEQSIVKLPKTAVVDVGFLESHN